MKKGGIDKELQEHISRAVSYTHLDVYKRQVRDFMLLKGGKVTNHDLVKHFKTVLTNPDNRGKILYFFGYETLIKRCGSGL